MSTVSARPRLLIVAPAAYPFGGVATWLDGLVAGLRRRDWPLEVALLAGHHHDVERYLERHPLGDVHPIANPGGSREGRQRALAEALTALQPEVVLAANVGDIEDAVDRLRRAGAPAPRLITTQHALQRDYFDHLRSRAEVVDGVIVTNRLGVELAREHARMESERIAYAPYGVDLGPPLSRRQSAGTLGIVWAGRLQQPQKRVLDLPAICAHLDAAGVDYRLELAGSGPEGDRLAAALAPFERAGRVRRLGEVPHERVRDAVYSGNDVLLVTSAWETGPIVAWEALAAGLAVVSARYLGSGREAALRHLDTALLFPVGDAPAAASALGRARDPELRRKLVAAGQAEVGSRYSTNASLDAWEGALLRLAALPPRSARARPEPIAPTGRLDRWLGPPRAESVRRLVRIAHRQRSPGDEWPHALAGAGDERAFLRLAAELDRPVGIAGRTTA